MNWSWLFHAVVKRVRWLSMDRFNLNLFHLQPHVTNNKVLDKLCAVLTFYFFRDIVEYQVVSSRPVA